MENFDLFTTHLPQQEALSKTSVVLRQFIKKEEQSIFSAVKQVLTQSPPRTVITPGGKKMSVKTSHCGQWGWVSTPYGYNYTAVNPVNNKPWPKMPQCLRETARKAAAQAGFKNFQPDSCLINCYTPGAKMGLHQDKDEKDYTQPIVSVSLGLTATFLWGGLKRSDKTTRIILDHNDVVVWGGRDRLRFHGVLTLQKGCHRMLGEQRINITFRRAR